MPDVAGRLRAVVTALISATFLVGLVGPALTQAQDPPNLDRFLAALGAVESNGRYDAVNATSGALGKYQILPANWRAWSLKYLGDADAPPTPGNQDAIARLKVVSLYNWLGDWASVGHWWLTGDGDTDPGHWSEGSRRYVNKVLASMGERLVPVRRTAPQAPVQPAPPGNVFDDASPAVEYSDGWDQAGHARYGDGKVHYSKKPAATATFTFVGTSVTWIGPKGPTRGQANIYLDDELVATVDVYASRFTAQTEIYSAVFDRKLRHTMTIEVVGTPGRGMIAVDQFVVDG